MKKSGDVPFTRPFCQKSGKRDISDFLSKAPFTRNPFCQRTDKFIAPFRTNPFTWTWTLVVLNYVSLVEFIQLAPIHWRIRWKNQNIKARLYKSFVFCSIVTWRSKFSNLGIFKNESGLFNRFKRNTTEPA